MLFSLEHTFAGRSRKRKMMVRYAFGFDNNKRVNEKKKKLRQLFMANPPQNAHAFKKAHNNFDNDQPNNNPL